MRGRHSEPVRRVKLYKKRKLWVALGIFGAFAISLQTGAIAPANAAGAAPTITTSETATDQATIVVQFRAPSGILTDYTQTKTVPAGYTGKFPIDYNAVIAQLRTKGYTYVTGAPAAPGSYEAGKTYTYIVGLSDLTAKVTHTDPKQAGDIAIPAYNTPFPESVGDKLSESAMNQTVTQTIHYLYPDGSTAEPDATQSITVYRDVKSVDLATGAVTYTSWFTVAPATTASSTKVVGYDPDPKTVTLANQDDPTEVTVKYSPSVRLQQISFVDNDDNGKTVPGGYTLRGVSNGDGKYDVTSSIPKGYVLADGQSASGLVHFTTTDPAPIEIHLKHGTRVIPATGPYTDEATQADLNRAFTQTVHFVYANGAKAADDKVQTAPSTRTATVDAVTGKRLSYSDWTNGDFAAVKAPEIPGYTPDVAEVPEAKNVDANAETKVTYTPNSQSTTVQFIDDDAAEQPVGNPINVAGVTDGTSSYDVTSQIPAGYVLAAGNSATGSVHFTATGADPIEIHLKHGTTVIGSADQDATAVNPLKLTQNYTQTIHYQYADNYKPTADVTQTATSTRTATVDNVTGQVVSYSDWINGNYAAVATPAVAGYTADVPEVAAATNVTADAEHTVTYTPDSKSTTVKFIDDDAAEQPVGNPIAVTGVTNGTKSYDVTSQIPTGYVLAAGNSATGSVHFTATGASPIEIHLKHGTTVIGSADQDATAVKPLKLTQNYTQTIHYQYADNYKPTADVTQTATSTRTATVDNVTGQVVSYSDWINGNYAAVATPAVAGYTADVPEVAAATNVTADAEHTVTYTPDSKSTTVQFIDDDAAEQPVGNPIAVAGVTNGTKSYDVTSQIPAGYVLVAGNSATGSVQFTADGAAPIEIHLKHGTTVIGSADQDATAVKPSDLTQNYTQTVHYVFADGRKAKDDTTQTATSTRTATIDNVTNAVLGYSDWTNGDFAAVPVPAIKGYTANVDEIPAQSDVTADAEYTVTYTADPVKDRGTLPVTGGQSGQGTGSQTGNQTGAGASTGAAAETDRHQATAGNAGATTANLTNQTAAAATKHGTLPSTGEVEASAALSLGIVTLMSTLALAGASRKRAR